MTDVVHSTLHSNPARATFGVLDRLLEVEMCVCVLVVCVCRCAELECELSRIRDLVVLLGTSIGRQPGGHHLPSHDDPVWVKLGPLGGVTFALDTAIKHTRVRQ